jgi:tRNA 2-thiouridine synthesizing protein B
MTCLHTISRSANSALLNSCIALLQPEDGILFIEDGVYHCINPLSLKRVPSSVKIFGLREDLLARAILSRLEQRIEAVDTVGFVELCCQHDKIVSWF